MDIPNASIAYYPDDIYECENEQNGKYHSEYRNGNKDHHNDLYNNNTTERDDKVINENDEYVKSILDKTSLQSLNRGWNNRNEIFIISIMLSCKNYKLMHDMSARNYNNIHKIMKIVLIIFSSFLSILTTYPGTCSNNALTIIQYCVTYIVTLFSILMNFFSYSQLSEKHKSAAADFLKIHHEIQQQMCLFKRDRLVAFRYISRIIKEYDRLIMTSPLIIPYILKKCKCEIKDSECNISDIVREMTTIKMDDINLHNPLQSNDDHTNGSSGSYNINMTSNNGVQSEQQRTIGINRTLVGNDTNLVINGDIEDNEIEKCNSRQIKDLRLRFFKENSTYEYLRFLQNEIG